MRTKLIFCMSTLKSSLIYGVFSTLFHYILILFLDNKFKWIVSIKLKKIFINLLNYNKIWKKWIVLAVESTCILISYIMISHNQRRQITMYDLQVAFLWHPLSTFIYVCVCVCVCVCVLITGTRNKDKEVRLIFINLAILLSNTNSQQVYSKIFIVPNYYWNPQRWSEFEGYYYYYYYYYY